MTALDPDLRLTPKQDARRRRVVQAALALGAEGGYDAVQMREVASTANVALGTIYRYFSSKDHLLAAATAEWTGQLATRLGQSPAKGDSMTDRLLDVLRRACRSMERQPQLTAALLKALAAPEVGVQQGAADVRSHVSAMEGDILAELDDDVRETVIAIVGHVWYSTLMQWVNGRRSFDQVYSELERTVRLLLSPYESKPAAKRNGRKR